VTKYQLSAFAHVAGAQSAWLWGVSSQPPG
jgi:hypothetical protein